MFFIVPRRLISAQIDYPTQSQLPRAKLTAVQAQPLFLALEDPIYPRVMIVARILCLDLLRSVSEMKKRSVS